MDWREVSYKSSERSNPLDFIEKCEWTCHVVSFYTSVGELRHRLGWSGQWSCVKRSVWSFVLDIDGRHRVNKEVNVACMAPLLCIEV